MNQRFPESPGMKGIKVMQVTDSLHGAGREHVAVNLANLLLTQGHKSYLCTTRSEGILNQHVTKNVKRLHLRRRHRFDLAALRRLIAFNRAHQVQLLHAHGKSVFISAIAAHFPPYPNVVWHDHYGHTNPENRRAWPYQMIASRISGIIAVSQPLAEWSRKNLDVSNQRIWYIPNFVCMSEPSQKPLELPGSPGCRIVCVAHFRPQKDHLTLLQAMELVKSKCPKAHLLLLGRTEDATYLGGVQREIERLRLEQNVSLLGQRPDVPDILRGCDIGVLSSKSEGMPLVLLEYGRVGLPTIATNVGQCAEVLDNGKAGILVSPSSPNELAEALLDLVNSSNKRSKFGGQFQQRIQAVYNPTSMMNQVGSVYEIVLMSKN